MPGFWASDKRTTIAIQIPINVNVIPVQDDEALEEGGEDATGNVTTGMKDDGGEEEEEEGLHPQDIDAYWLQRRISKACEEKGAPIDADKSQQLATDVFKILQVEP